jgi:hypothetical protein
MPNYTISTQCRATMAKRAGALMEVHVNTVMSAFPLSADEVQACVLDRPTFELCQKVSKAGYQINVDGDPLCMFSDPAIKRSILAEIDIRDGVFIKRQTYKTFNADVFYNKPDHIAYMDLHTLEPQRRELLVEWCAEAARAHRLQTMVTATIGAALDHCKSVGHILATWPMLTLLAQEDKLWRERFANPPRNSPNYAPGVAFLQEWRTEMRACEPILLAATMLTDPDLAKLGRERPVCTRICAVQKLPGDGKW